MPREKDPQAGDHMTEPLGTYAAYLSPLYRGDAASYLASLRRLRAMPAPDLVLPGHPRHDARPSSPIMTQEHWEKLLDPGIAEMAELVEHHRVDGKNFLDGTQKKLLKDLFYLGDFKRFAVYGCGRRGQVLPGQRAGGAGIERVRAGAAGQAGAFADEAGGGAAHLGRRGGVRRAAGAAQDVPRAGGRVHGGLGAGPGQVPEGHALRARRLPGGSKAGSPGRPCR